MNIFTNPTKAIPKQDGQIVRVSMEELEIGGRKVALPTNQPTNSMSVRHVSTPGGAR